MTEADQGEQEPAVRALAWLTEVAAGTEAFEKFTPSASVEVRLSNGIVVVEIDTSSTVDVAAERKRLEKDLAAAQKELSQTASKLNNEAFLAQTVVMTPNYSLSIPNMLKKERPNDYYDNTATIEWPPRPLG